MIAFAVLFAVTQASPSVPPDNHATTNSSVRQNAEPTKAPSAPNAISPTVQSASPIPPTTISTLPPVTVARDWVDFVALGASCALFVVGAVGVFMALRTLSVLRRQTDATVNSERSWIMIDIEWQKGAHIFDGTNDKGMQNTGIYVDYVCRNMGKAFAQITDKGYVLKIVTTLPQEPDFNSIDDFYHATEYLAPDSESRYLLSGISCVGSRRNRLIVLYGRAKYRDVYGEHETRFGYLVTSMGNLDRLAATDYPQYNKHT
jgi:hypothetical protein